MKYCFVFVCQGGILERQASLLATSLYENIKCDAEFVAAIPDYPEVQPVSEEVISYLTSLKVRIRTISNDVDKTYPIANKIMCFDIPTEAENLIFLDSDMLCFREIHDDFFEPEYQIAARLTDFSDLTPEEWDEIYLYCRDERPHMNYTSLVSHEPMPLSFNSGLIITTEARKLYQSWIAYARKLNDPVRFPKTRPFLDQISLAMAVTELDLQIKYLNQTDHLSSSIYPVDIFNPPLFVHYYEGIYLLGDPLLASFTSHLVKRYDGLANILKNDKDLSLI